MLFNEIVGIKFFLPLKTKFAANYFVISYKIKTFFQNQQMYNPEGHNVIYFPNEYVYFKAHLRNLKLDMGLKNVQEMLVKKQEMIQ